MTERERQGRGEKQSQPGEESGTGTSARGVFPSPERRRRAVGWGSGDVVRAALLVIVIYGLIRLLWYASALFFVIFLGILFGLAVSAAVDQLQKLRVPRGVGAGLVVLSFFALLVGFGAILAPTVQEQAGEVRQRLPQAIDKVEQWLQENQNGVIGMLLGVSGDGEREEPSQGDTAAADAEPSAEGAGDSQTPPPPRAGERAEEAPAGLRERVEGQISGLTGYLFPFLSSTVAVISGLFLVLFFAVYTAAEPDLYHRGLMHLFPHHMRRRAGEVLSTTATVLRKWLIAQLIGMTVVAFVTTIVLMLLGVQAALALGILAGLLEFVPTIGPILAAIPAIGMGFLDSPQKALWVTVAFIVIQQLESQLLTPLLMKERIDLPPALTISAQALMAILFGFLGLLVAVPLLAAAMVPIKMLYVEGVVGDDVDVGGNDEDD